MLHRPFYVDSPTDNMCGPHALLQVPIAVGRSTDLQQLPPAPISFARTSCKSALSRVEARATRGHTEQLAQGQPSLAGIYPEALLLFLRWWWQPNTVSTCQLSLSLISSQCHHPCRSYRRSFVQAAACSDIFSELGSSAKHRVWDAPAHRQTLVGVGRRQ